MKNLRTADRSWNLIAHTADLRMEVRGSSLEELMLNAAAGLAELLDTEPVIISEAELDVLVTGDGPDELLVDWLREILYQNQTRAFVPLAAEIVELTETSLKARLVGGLRPEEREPSQEIKAVTYHGLSVVETDSGLVAKIVFDI